MGYVSAFPAVPLSGALAPENDDGPPKRAVPVRRVVSRRRLERGDVDGLRALVARLGVEAHAGALGQRLEARGVDASVVDEEVLARVVRRDEAEALVVVEPLDGSGGHSVIPPGIFGAAIAEDSKRQRRGTLAQLCRGWFPDGTAHRIPTRHAGCRAI